jgi:hypothetical protein
MNGSQGRGGEDSSRGPGRRPPQGPPVVGKRPSQVAFLAACALLWFAAAAFAFFGLDAGWRLIPAICFAGIGILYLRGAAGSYLRRPAPPPSGKKR